MGSQFKKQGPLTRAVNGPLSLPLDAARALVPFELCPGAVGVFI